MKSSGIAVAGLATLLAACAQTGGPAGGSTQYQTPAAQRATMTLPSGCVLAPDGSGQACTIAQAEKLVVVGFFDDFTIPFSAAFSPPDVMGKKRDAEGRGFWEKHLTVIAALDGMGDRHNGSPLTHSESAVVPPRSLPAGADACVRNDWAGTEKSNATWRSRGYACIRWIPTADAYQQVEVEVAELKRPGAAPAPIDFGKTADAIFASLRLQ